MSLRGFFYKLLFLNWPFCFLESFSLASTCTLSHTCPTNRVIDWGKKAFGVFCIYSVEFFELERLRKMLIRFLKWTRAFCSAIGKRNAKNISGKISCDVGDWLLRSSLEYKT